LFLFLLVAIRTATNPATNAAAVIIIVRCSTVAPVVYAVRTALKEAVVNVLVGAYDKHKKRA
jgi:L-aminopeptidase/D-esterase-like protein